ncbi:MAG TPA: ChaN family lipoprotein, partial [Alicycliphilus sp.]|nr:ChaN family lipoprotein [Alicycliphilus sp.]
ALVEDLEGWARRILDHCGLEWDPACLEFHKSRRPVTSASAAQVRAALHWNEDAWPWQNYGPVIMAAVAADVPVRGGNLPLGRMRAAMQDEALDAHLPPAQLELQRQAIADGHCGLLPAERLMPMVRIQLARDASLAQAVLDARQNGRTVLLVAGWGHVRSDLGVPTWLPPELKVKTVIAQAGKALEATETEANYMYATPALAPRDHCAELRAHPPASMAPVRR